MASPFSIFRKNQKFMLAVLTILAMFGFVFLPILGDSLGFRSAGPVNKVVVKTEKFGDLRESDVSALLQEHRRILGVLTEVKQIGNQYPAMARQMAEYTFGPPTEDQVVNNWLLARHAEQLDMVVSDATINAFLKEWTGDKVKASEFQAAFKRSGLSESQFFNFMRDELRARQLREMFYVSLEGITPAQRWEYFTRVKQMATIEVAAIPVANYVDQIDEPTDEELKTFFEENKERFPLPDSPEPGFREPQRIAMQWFKADPEKFLATVTDEDIKKHYEENKEAYDQAEKKAESTAVEPRETEPNGVEKPAAEKPAASEKPAADEKPAVPEKPATAEKSAEEEKVVTPESKTAAATNEKPVEPKTGLTESLKNRIRREIADERIMKIFERLREPLDQYRTAWSKYEVALIQQKSEDTEGSQKSPPEAPAKPNFEELANQYGLSAGHSDLITQWEAQSLDVGASLVGGRMPTWHYAFQSLAKLRPEMSVDMTGDYYLFWKTDETKERIAKFTDVGVRQRVLGQWRMIQAREPALQQAEKLAAEVGKTKKTLAEALAGRPKLKVIVPPPFSWITFGNVPLGSAPNAARIGEVSGVEFPGDEFMRAVFRLEPGQSGAAMNAPKDTAYVIRLREFSPSREVLWTEFEVDDFRKYAPAAAGDQQQIIKAWLDEIKSLAGMAWQRKPDQMLESGPHDEE
jgi:hypothetical protein